VTRVLWRTYVYLLSSCCPGHDNNATVQAADRADERPAVNRGRQTAVSTG
jgi:hypothetical protein